MHTVLLAIDPCLTELNPRVAGDVDLINNHDCNADQTVSDIQIFVYANAPCKINREQPGDEVLPTFALIDVQQSYGSPPAVSSRAFRSCRKVLDAWTEMTRLQIRMEKVPELRSTETSTGSRDSRYHICCDGEQSRCMDTVAKSSSCRRIASVGVTTAFPHNCLRLLYHRP
jgi:hypothetical protein